ncbi:type II toxin-antitoxin system VapC family toxin [Geotalea uraniireducens]|uniref:Ribonuclease VapC n=1 Tax=Geotalea uraniireducens (strain Rf4) TaxID=351605 RepID=A5G6A7_GEOUR|nr:PIN domain-containing protein [Geotalea uraniireducens]ABQ27325.1 PilT protein domain protein [Geotalea uraniireducens Rf4]
MSIFIDTSGFLAVLDRDDASHARVKNAWVDMLSSDDLLVTTNYVLVETFALVQTRLGLAATKVFQEDIVPVLQTEWIDKTLHSAAVGIMLSASRRKLSLVDCVSFETMRLLGITTAFTLDKRFREQGFSCIPS